MKVSIRILSLILGAALFFLGCGSDESDPKSQEEIQFELLKGTWTLDYVTLDATSKTASFPGLELNIPGTFSTNGTFLFQLSGTRPASGPWPGESQWKFGADPKTQLIRGPGSEDLSMNYSVTASQLLLTFTCSSCSFAGGRTNSVDGKWEFAFKR